jgi:hypothetical protein
MKLYKIWRIVNDDYDTYYSAVVCAKDEDDARSMHPGLALYKDYANWDGKNSEFGSRCNKADVQVKYLGTADKSIERSVIVASFNAG